LRDLLPLVITGLISGVVYGLAASGLVLTFKTSGIFNFGYGAVLTAAALLFYYLRVTLELDWRVAFVVCVLVAGPVFGLAMELMARRLAQQSTQLKIAGTVGLMVLVPAVCVIAYPMSVNRLPLPPFLPFNDHRVDRVKVLGVYVFGDQLVTAAVAVAAVVGLYLVLRLSSTGLRMRALVDDPTLLSLEGIEPVRIRRLAWIVGSTFAALSGLLILPMQGLQPYTLTFLATYAFAASALGAFRSIPLALVGGLLVGVAQSVVGYVVNSNGWISLSSLSDAAPFVLLVVALLVIPKRRLAVMSAPPRRDRPQWRAHASYQVPAGVVLLVLLAVVPAFAGERLVFYSTGLAQAILVLSLGLLVRLSGQVSLGHSAFAAIGAAAFSQLTIQAELPWLLALLAAAAITIPVGLLVALPAMRLNGVYLALSTFGFGILVQRLVYPQSWMFFSYGGSRPMPAPFGSSDPSTIYYTVLVSFVLLSGLVVVVGRSRLGRVLRGMAGSETAVATLGLSANVTKVLVFCLSAFIAAVGGIMTGIVLTTVDSTTVAFQPYSSFLLLALLVVSPMGAPWYAVFAAVAGVMPAYITGSHSADVLNALFGLVCIVTAMEGGPPQAPAWLRETLARGPGRRLQRPATGTPVSISGIDVDQASQTAQGALRKLGDESTAARLTIRGLTIDFGGHRAVDDVSLTAAPGEITGLIGPNGAGKTSTFNAVCGINRQVTGTIAYGETALGGHSPAWRARRGLGRTFQRMELCDDLTVLENVALGYECVRAGRGVVSRAVAGPLEHRRMVTAAQEAMELCGITQLGHATVGDLSTGHRRLVELARCLAGPFELLLLDEPSSGLDREETRTFGRILERVVRERGCGVLLIEHDMSLVMRICSSVHVLDFGRLIESGTPTQVAASPIVRAAYLGSDFELPEPKLEGDLDLEESVS
jgi:ABC-type branched-subunit amino acid transport system ATPase component/branched-subunit amino acid ABC-type transport system permease component